MVEIAEERLLGVFICSTAYDLADQRQAIVGVIQNLCQNQISMELFGARPDQPIEVCLGEVGRCDLMVVVVAHMYGSIVEGQGISFSEAEYQHGQQLGKPCLVYMPQDDVPILPKHFESDPTKLAKLQRWKTELKKRHTVAHYRSTIDLTSRVAVDLPKARKLIVEGSPVVPSTGARIRPEDSALLASEQNEHLKLVCVYAPHPLEAMPDGMHDALRIQVARNLVAGVKYVYFVESNAGVARIAQLVERLAQFAPVPFQEAIRLIRQNVSVCVLDPPSFLTHFTVHFGPQGNVDVFQSVVLPDRNDQITKLPRIRAREVHDRILAMLEQYDSARREQNLIVRQKIV